jgi:hypothetical protein
LLTEPDGEVGFPQSRIRNPQIAEITALASAINRLARDFQSLLMELDGAVGLPQTHIGNPQIAECIALAPAVSDLTSYFKVLFMELDRTMGIPYCWAVSNNVTPRSIARAIVARLSVSSAEP